ncbi:hypothetical protein [Kitasatospora sp. NPDC002965]|uniref:hypothetical protein n=1 Tax=Kitasatospora sp. NPDC002965 TaxID=3154775 RepID=UPI0033B4AA52
MIVPVRRDLADREVAPGGGGVAEEQVEGVSGRPVTQAPIWDLGAPAGSTR